MESVLQKFCNRKNKESNKKAGEARALPFLNIKCPSLRLRERKKIWQIKRKEKKIFFQNIFCGNIYIQENSLF